MTSPLPGDEQLQALGLDAAQGRPPSSESPDDVGGFVRLYDAAELIRVGAPIYLKFGIRNAPAIYPVGRHLRDVAVSTGIERVRRARLTLDILDCTGGAPLPMSKPGEHLLSVPPRFAEPSDQGNG